MRLLLRRSDGTGLQPLSVAWIHQRQPGMQRKLLRGREWKWGDLKLRDTWRMQQQFHFRLISPMRNEPQRTTVRAFPFAYEVTHWLPGTRQRG